MIDRELTRLKREQARQIRRLEHALVTAAAAGNDYDAYIIAKWELPAARSLARLVHKS